MLSDETMVIDLAVDSQNNGVIGVGQGLGARLNTDDAEALMAQDSLVADQASAPIRATVSDLLRKLECRRLEFLHVGMTVTGEDSTHRRRSMGYQLGGFAFESKEEK